MTQFLLNCFVKESDKVENATVRSAIGAMAGITGICCNCLLFLGKLFAGLAVGSIAIVADAVNNLTDAASSVVTLLGFRLAQRPADRDHPYGHARYEYLAALAVAVMILFLGAELTKSSVVKILHPVMPETTAITFCILAASILVKLWMFGFYRKLGEKIHSSVLTTAALDSRSDVLATGAVLVSCLAAKWTPWNIDGIVGLIVALLVIRSGIGAAKDTISPLLGRRADQQLECAIRELVLSHGRILGIHDLLIHDYGPGQCFASIHAEVSAEEDILSSHDLMEDIEEDALEKLNVHLVIHCDPVVENDPQLRKLRRIIRRVNMQFDPAISLHDLRLSEYEGETRLVFDLEIPYESPVSTDALRQSIEAALQAAEEHYPVVIHFDGKG